MKGIDVNLHGYYYNQNSIEQNPTLRISRSNEQSPANAYTGSIFYELQVITFPI